MERQEERKVKEYTFPFEVGDRVRFKNKIGRDEGFITSITIGNGSYYFTVIWSDKSQHQHWDFELELIN